MSYCRHGRHREFSPPRKAPSFGTLLAGSRSRRTRPTTRRSPMSATTSNIGPRVAAFMVGAAVGAGVALLYAPRSGKDTRRELYRRGREIKNRVTDAVEATTAAVRARLDN